MEEHQEEIIWKDIPGYEGLYQVNQWGDIYPHPVKALVYQKPLYGRRAYLIKILKEKIKC